MPGEEPLLRHTARGPTLSWRGIQFYPGADPIDYARRKARVFSPSPRTLIFVPSVGLGHGIMTLLESLPEGGAVLVIEAFQEVMGIAVTIGLPADPRLTIIRTDDPSAAAAALRKLGTGRFRRIIELPLSAGYRLAPGVYGRIRRALDLELKRHWQNRLTLIAMGSLQVRNIIANLPLLGTASDFSSLSTDMPVLVAGAGPSLEESLPVLKRLRERFLLVAVDTALPCLTVEGVHPDIVIALEAQAANLKDFVPGFSMDSVLACDLSSFPPAARLAAGRLSFFSSVFAPLRLFDRLEACGLRPLAIPPLGSVGVAGLHAALRLSRGDVYLTGLDFAFSHGKTHARGSPAHLHMLNGGARFSPVGLDAYRAIASRQLIRAASKTGGTVMTDAVLQSYRDSLLAEAQEAGSRVMDCGADGLDLGVGRVSARELEERLASGKDSKHRLHRDPARCFRADRLPAFIASELQILESFLNASAGLPAKDVMLPDGLNELLHDVDYTWVHFPDEPDSPTPGPGFLARVRVAASFYRQRFQRTASLL
jgi:hypothetical protein